MTDTSLTVTSGININALPFKAYQSIYNEWFRDQDLEDPVDISFTKDGNQDNYVPLMQTRYRAWEKDYFTSARPNAQKGDPVNFLGVTENGEWLKTDSGAALNGATATVDAAADGTEEFALRQSGGANHIVPAFATIQDLRKAEAMQSYIERLQRAGNRYREYLAGIWGVVSDDARIDIPEYLGGSTSPIVISEVLTTTNQDNTTTDNNVAGELYGHGISVGQNHGFKRSFKEHGFVMGIISILPKSGYAEGLHKMFTRGDRFDYYLPDFALIGEEPILNRELHFSHLNPQNALQSQTFGYQQRYAEYKYPAEHNLAGDMRDSLNYWHLNREIGGVVNLSSTFVTCRNSEDNLNRIFNVIDPANDNFFIQVYNKVDAIRPMPYQSIPDLT